MNKGDYIITWADLDAGNHAHYRRRPEWLRRAEALEHQALDAWIHAPDGDPSVAARREAWQAAYRNMITAREIYHSGQACSCDDDDDSCDYCAAQQRVENSNHNLERILNYE